MKTIAKWVDTTYKGKFVTALEASRIVGRSTRTIKRWRKLGKVKAPSQFVELGNGKVNLYSFEDIKELKNYAEIVRRGRPRNPS
jgi:predicted site-specific integrase-resolvase